jgi:8-oxo-dGTP pyrophosphatase MutT (NUDIX family)
LLVLLVTSRSQPGHWIFPKGHVEPGETADVAALREAEEEGGITGTSLEQLGSLSYEWEDEKYRVQYFLIAAHDKGGPREGRQQLWCRYEEALDFLTFEDTRSLLTSAWPRIQDSPHFEPPDERR